MGQKHNKYFYKFINTLKSLKDQYPTQEVSNHISGALQDYKDFWGLSDKELSLALDKYAATLEIDPANIDQEYVNKVVEEGMHLDTILDEDEDDWLDTFDHKY
jgi:hypothetical protein